MNKIVFVTVISTLFYHSIALANVAILDVRTPAEFTQGHISNAVNIDVTNQNFRKKVSKLDREDSYKICCAAGKRAGVAASVMRELGFKNVENLGSLENAKKVLTKSNE